MKIVGILNVTPDSYVERGAFASPDAALVHAGRILAEGADIIEVGGESTGPGSSDVSVEEEIHRTINVIKNIRYTWADVKISIDTWKAPVAAAALEAGATMVNDVTAGRSDPGILGVAARHHADLVLMYSKDPTPRTTVRDRRYDDVVATILSFLKERIDAAVAAGVHPARIILDPGLGHFLSGDPSYSFEVIARLAEFTALGHPVFLSPSRKSFLAGPENLPVADRLPGTVAASAIAVLNGAEYIRTHDVLAVRRCCEIAAAIRGSRI